VLQLNITAAHSQNHYQKNQNRYDDGSTSSKSIQFFFETRIFSSVDSCIIPIRYISCESTSANHYGKSCCKTHHGRKCFRYYDETPYQYYIFKFQAKGHEQEGYDQETRFMEEAKSLR
jgi:hypothetical protein